MNLRDKNRFISGVILLTVPLIIFATTVGAPTTSGLLMDFLHNLFVWIILFHAVGLGIAAISASRDINKTFVFEYFLLYPITLFASSSVLFLLISSSPIDGSVSYFAAASISLYLGLNIDHLSGWILRK